MRAILSQPGGAHCRTVCRRRHHGHPRARARAAARGALGPAGRGGEQAGRHRRDRGRSRGESGAGRLHAPDHCGCDLRQQSAFSLCRGGFRPAPTDPLQEFAPITGLGISPQALTVNPRLPARTLSELIALARKQPGEITYGTFGVGSSGHLNIILLERMTGTRFTAVHYRGAAPAITDVIGGHIGMVIVSIGLIAQPWQSGQLRVLGFGSTTRLAQYPDVPTLAESGLPGYEAGSWYGLAAPEGTPPEIIATLNAETRRIFEDPAIPRHGVSLRTSSSRSRVPPRSLPRAFARSGRNGARSFATRGSNRSDRVRSAEPQSSPLCRVMAPELRISCACAERSAFAPDRSGADAEPGRSRRACECRTSAPPAEFLCRKSRRLGSFGRTGERLTRRRVRAAAGSWKPDRVGIVWPSCAIGFPSRPKQPDAEARCSADTLQRTPGLRVCAGSRGLRNGRAPQRERGCRRPSSGFNGGMAPRSSHVPHRLARRRSDTPSRSALCRREHACRYSVRGCCGRSCGWLPASLH